METTVGKLRTAVTLFAVTAFCAVCFAGCRTPMQTRDVKLSGFLGDSSGFTVGKSGQPQRYFLAPDARFEHYSRVMIDPVSIWASEGSALSKLPKEEAEALQSYLYGRLNEELSKDYTVVEQAGPGVLRLRVALTEAKGGSVVRNTISSILPIGLAISALKLAATGTHTAVGEADMELELLDSETGKRLAAAVDGRAGRKVIASGNFTRWGDVKDAFDFWAQRTRERLEKLRNRTFE